MSLKKSYYYFPEPKDERRHRQPTGRVAAPPARSPFRYRRDAGYPGATSSRQAAVPRGPQSATPRGQDQQFVELISDTLNFS